MIRISFSIVLLIFFVACQQKQLETADMRNSKEFVLDSILTFSSEQQLIAKYGTENVVRDTAYYPEGAGEYLINVLFPHRPDWRVEIMWNDSVTFSMLNAVSISNDSSRWKTSEGITVGTTLRQLVELNKKDVMFSGLGWDYGGYVNWDGGMLQHRGITIILDAPSELNEGVKLDSLYGDQSISSASELLNGVTLVVSKLTLAKEHE